jgi:hypothetical protein
MKRIESRDVMVNATLCFIGYSPPRIDEKGALATLTNDAAVGSVVCFDLLAAASGRSGT